MDNEKKDECCSTGKSGCCCGSKKIFFAALLALIVFGLGYCLGKQAMFCHKDGGMKMCPIGGKMMTPVPPPQQPAQ